MSLVIYVSGHGLGHATREITILQQLAPDIPLVIKSASPEWHWRNELPGRNFEFLAETFDVGSVQKDSLDSDAGATLTAWSERDRLNQSRFSAECAEVTRRGTRLIVSDVPSFPLTVARAVGIPSVCIANFTWADIYSDLSAEAPGLASVAERLSAEYSEATLLLEAGFALPMPYFRRRTSVGLVARSGTARRTDLLAALPPSARNRRLGLVYAGNWGLPIPYERLERFTDWHFLSLDAVPQPCPGNWTVIQRNLMSHPDLVASVDLVISKIGYGLVGECLTTGTPILYCPRNGFAEYPVIDQYLTGRPHGIRLTLAQFAAADWGSALAEVAPYGSLPKEPADGGISAARILEKLYQDLDFARVSRGETSTSVSF